MYTIQNCSGFYIAPSCGKGGYNGHTGLTPTPDGFGNGPYSSFEEALFFIGEMRKNGVDRPLRLILAEDVYLSAPVVINKNHKRLTIESAGAQKRIIGGVKIENWKADSFRGISCLSAQLPKKADGSRWEFTDLYVNGKRATVTRYPETGAFTLVDTEDQFREGFGNTRSQKGSSRWFVVHKEDLLGLDNIEDATINYYHYWVDEHSPIESYDPETGKLVMTLNSIFSCSTDWENRAQDSVRYYLTNIPNGFSQPGHWYLDRAAQIVYYIPENDTITPDTIEAFVPTTDQLFIIEGEDISLQNLELTCTVGDYICRESYEKKPWVEVPNGFASDIQSVCNAPGAIVFRNAEGGGIHNCHIHGVGIYGIEIGKGCNHIRIENNHIEDICAGGITILGASAEEDPSDATTDILIHGNKIHNVGVRYLAGCGILLRHASNNEISDNEIYDTEYTGISVGWIWGYSDSTTYRNKIVRNYIHHIGKGNLADMGAIYILGRNRGTVVAENRIHDINAAKYGAWGIYLDEGASYITVEKNVVYRAKGHCFHLHFGAGNLIRNNIFLGMGSPCMITSREELLDQAVFENNIFVVENSQIYNTKSYHSMKTARNILWDLSGHIDIIYSDEFDVRFDYATWTNVLGQDAGSVIADPKIPGLREFDFILAPDSPAYALGFQPIPDYVTKRRPEESSQWHTEFSGGNAMPAPVGK